MSQSNPAPRAQLATDLVQKAMALITPAQRIALLAHEGPDGDCIGSILGMTHILQMLGKTCLPACADPPPGYLAFLPGAATVAQDLGAEDFDLVIALDAGELRRFGSLYTRHRDFLERVPILNIDHHLGSDGCGQVNIIDPRAAATAEMLLLFQQQVDLPLPTNAAICLLTGLITDTNSFQFTNTTPRSLEAAAELLRHGAVPQTIALPIYRERPLAQARLQAAIIARAQTSCAGRLIWSWADRSTLTAAGALPEMDNNSAGTLRDIAGVQIAAFFKSYNAPDETRLSLRSAAPYDAAAICRRVSQGQGGGHARAAGASFRLPLQETITLVVKELEKVLDE